MRDVLNVRYLDEDTVSDKSELTEEGLQVSSSSGSNTIIRQKVSVSGMPHSSCSARH